MDPLKPNPLVEEILNPAVPQLGGKARPRPPQVYSGDRAVFVGLLGDPVTQPGGGADWTLLYLDLGLTTWLLVEPDSIVYHRKFQDRMTPSVTWNVIWVKAAASVGHGTGPVADAQFLTGDFVRARDFPSTPVGGTFGPEVGAFQIGTSPNCCTRKSR